MKTCLLKQSHMERHLDKSLGIHSHGEALGEKIFAAGPTQKGRKTNGEQVPEKTFLSFCQLRKELFMLQCYRSAGSNFLFSPRHRHGNNSSSKSQQYGQNARNAKNARKCQKCQQLLQQRKMQQKSCNKERSNEKDATHRSAKCILWSAPLQNVIFGQALASEDI